MHTVCKLHNLQLMKVTLKIIESNQSLLDYQTKYGWFGLKFNVDLTISRTTFSC